MKVIARIPFYLWLLILTVLCYAVWNPWKLSFFHMIIGDNAAKPKINEENIPMIID